MPNVSATDPLSAAKEAKLRYVSDASPGIHRIKKGKKITYIYMDGKPVHDAATIERIKHVVIPPAWTDVWICPHPNGHLQATGRDARNRKQFRYHTQWRIIRDRTKYDRLLEFGKMLPKIRSRIAEDLQKPGLPREKVLAAIIRILDLTHIRIGNEEYARENKSYGLTTLKHSHVDLDGSSVRFIFRGKSGQLQDVQFKDPKIAKIIKKCEDLPGHELFGYINDEGEAIDVQSDHVNAYLHEITGAEITAKIFRTWGGTVQATLCLYRSGECDTELKSKHAIAETIKEVAAFLGNKPATCKKYYIDPRVFSAFQRHHLCAFLSKELTNYIYNDEKTLQPAEEAVLKLLEGSFD